MFVDVVDWGSSVSGTRADAGDCADCADCTWGSVDGVEGVVVCVCGALIGVVGRFEHFESLDGTQLEQGRLFFTQEQFLQRPLLLHEQQFGMLSKNKLDFHYSTFTFPIPSHVEPL